MRYCYIRRNDNEKRLVSERIFILLKYTIRFRTANYCYFCIVSNSFSKQIIFDKKPLLATVIPQLRKDGMYYEVNIKGYPRFFMSWSSLDRYDVAPRQETSLPYQLVLAVSDMIERSIDR